MDQFKTRPNNSKDYKVNIDEIRRKIIIYSLFFIIFSDGFVNTSLMIENNDQSDGPKKLMFKKYGGSVLEEKLITMMKMNTPLIQGIIAYEQSCRKWGPKLFGLFNEGRIEEFIDCHTLTAEEAFTPDISKDVAKSYARFHSLKLPFNQEPHDCLIKMFKSLDDGRKELSTFLSTCDEAKTKQTFEKLFNFQFEQEYKWINQIKTTVDIG